MQIFWHVAPCRWVCILRRFERFWCLFLQHLAVQDEIFEWLTVEMKTSRTTHPHAQNNSVSWLQFFSHNQNRPYILILWRHRGLLWMLIQVYTPPLHTLSLSLGGHTNGTVQRFLTVHFNPEHGDRTLPRNNGNTARSKTVGKLVSGLTF